MNPLWRNAEILNVIAVSIVILPKSFHWIMNVLKTVKNNLYSLLHGGA